MKNLVLNIIYKLRLELPHAVSGSGDEDGCWCLAAARRRMSGPSLPRCQLLATINTDHWPWDLEPSHQWSQEESWQPRPRLIRLLLSLDNKFTFIRIIPRPPNPTIKVNFILHFTSTGSVSIWKCSCSVSGAGVTGHGLLEVTTLRLRVLWPLRRLRVTHQARGNLEVWAWTLPLLPSPPLSYQTWRFAFELQHHYGQKSWDSKVKLSESFIILILSAVKRQKLFSP